MVDYHNLLFKSQRNLQLTPHKFLLNPEYFSIHR